MKNSFSKIMYFVIYVKNTKFDFLDQITNKNLINSQNFISSYIKIKKIIIYNGFVLSRASYKEKVSVMQEESKCGPIPNPCPFFRLEIK